MSGETMMILFRQISQRNLIYVNIFVSASSWSQWKSILSLLWLVKLSAGPSRFAKWMVWEEVKAYDNISLHFWKTYFTIISPGWFYCSNFQGNIEMTLDVSVINNFNFLYMCWVFCPAFPFSSFYWKFKIISISNYNQHYIFKKD